MSALTVAPHLVFGSLLAPRAGPGVCPHCWEVIASPGRCRACSRNERHVDALLPVAYCIAGSALHHALADYKRCADPSVPALAADLAGLLDSFLAVHECCLWRRLETRSPPVVTTVPSAQPSRDDRHPLRRITGELCAATRSRYARLLFATGRAHVSHRFDAHRFDCPEPLGGTDVLLVDDTWTSGASAESAAAALKAAGAGRVGAVVIGRYLNAGWADDARSRGAALQPDICPFCSDECAGPEAGEPLGSPRCPVR